MVWNRQRRVAVDRGKLGRFALRLAGELRLPTDSFSAVLVSDRRMQELNRRYRAQATTTDVLSFPLTEGDYLGEVVISAETARRQARRLGHGLQEELQMLLLHGVLHLLGYDHEKDNGRMNRREHHLRRRLGLE